MKTLCFIITFAFLFSSLYAQDEVNNNSNLNDKRNSAIYVAQDFILTFSINYERLFPVSEKANIGLRGALGRDGGNKDNTAIGGAVFVYGRSKHFFEFSIAYQQPNLFENGSDDNPKLTIMAGYRYQSSKGFLFKVYPEFLPDIWPDEDSWGSLPFLGFALGYSF